MQTCGQVLLTLDNLATRPQYLNARSTFQELLRYGAVPVVNENDTVAVEQLRIGNNDTLSAQVAALVRADWLFLLTDVDAVYDCDPGKNPEAKPIREVCDASALKVDTSGGGQWGTGGMATKLTAAHLATAAGCRVVVCLSDPDNVLKALAGEQIGTAFLPAPEPVRGRGRWILSVPPSGDVFLDVGAVAAVKRHGSLFAGGVLATGGDFEVHGAVRLCDAEGREFACGIINYSREDVERLKGLPSKAIAKALGFAGREEIVHRTNICLLPAAAAPSEHGFESTQGSRCPSHNADCTDEDEDEDEDEDGVDGHSADGWSPTSNGGGLGGRRMTPMPATESNEALTNAIAAVEL
jgi:glutamate 5-kinase